MEFVSNLFLRGSSAEVLEFLRQLEDFGQEISDAERELLLERLNLRAKDGEEILRDGVDFYMCRECGIKFDIEKVMCSSCGRSASFVRWFSFVNIFYDHEAKNFY